MSHSEHYRIWHIFSDISTITALPRHSLIPVSTLEMKLNASAMLYEEALLRMKTWARQQEAGGCYNKNPFQTTEENDTNIRAGIQILKIHIHTEIRKAHLLWTVCYLVCSVREIIFYTPSLSIYSVLLFQFVTYLSAYGMLEREFLRELVLDFGE